MDRNWKTQPHRINLQLRQYTITYGEAEQFFTPESVTTLIVQILVDDEGKSCKSVCDPACGSGRCLLAIAEKHPNWEFTGQDVDHRCVQITAINMGLRNLFGYAVWQNTLTLDVHRVYRVGFNLHGGVIREVPIDQCPFDYRKTELETEPIKPQTIEDIDKQ